ncbi:MAG: co-chaperone DjlA [Thalassobium sp.]|uniref:co-chaperone DjlA n=1 Tax=Thalassolituus oleivorans TaxID=187493 RepID=UPI000BD3A7DF|nr:co-chaperone DjlA [Thalassolituus oleivorans]PCI49717.1 MAG: co-chaperone DjlA [Oceanospirillales bacterium]PHQ88203.1 MAG: co-chaperone DjlA [Thalassobium sp.]
MNFWFGKLTGAVIGLFSGGPFGLLIGAFAGHLFDQTISKNLLGKQESEWTQGSPERRPFKDSKGSSKQNARVQEVYFATVFRVMGCIAKADGRVSEREIAAATTIMDQMGLTGDQRQKAIGLFTEGKGMNYDLAPDLKSLSAACRDRDDLIQMFVEIQLSVAYADGQLSRDEKQLFSQICKALGVGAFQFEWIHNRVRAGARSQQSQGRAGGRQQAPRTNKTSELNDAYAILGVKSSVADAELKKAYRRLMSEHHPDKLIAKGLPESMMRLAKEKTQEIQTAYDKIRKHRRASATG